MKYSVLTILLTGVAGQALAQENLALGTGFGSTTITAQVNTSVPSQMPTVPAGNNQVIPIPDHPVIGDTLFNSRKGAVGTRVPIQGPAGPPLVTYSDGRVVLLNGSQPEFALKNDPTIGFEGIGWTNFVPPDPEIAVGPDEILAVVNSGFTRYGRDGSKLGGMSFQDFFAPIFNTLCNGNCLFFDPAIRYDQIHGRFLLTLTSRDFTSGASYILIAVSNGATYSGGWRIWAMDARKNGTTTASVWADYPRLGYDFRGVSVTMNVYDATANTFLYSRIRLLNKTELYSTSTTVLNWWDAWGLKNEDGSNSSSVQPVTTRGRQGVLAATTVFVNAADKANSTTLTLWQVVGPQSAAPSLNRLTVRNLWAYDLPASAPQAGGSITIDTGDARVLKAVVRGDLLYTAQNTSYLDNPVSVTYDIIDLANNLATTQVKLGSGYFFYPAFEVPASMGTQKTLPNVFVTSATSSALGPVTYPGVFRIHPGQAFYNPSGVGSTVRWGDFSGGALDPVSGGLWAYGDYSKLSATNNSQWGTWTSFFPLRTTQVFQDVPPASPIADAVNVMSSFGITQGCSVSPANYCPWDLVPRWAAAVFIIRALYGSQFTYAQTPYFTDVPVSDPHFSYVQKFRELGLTTGCTDTTFCPDTAVTRAQLAVFLIRAKLKPLFGDSFTFPATPYFTDVPASDPFFRYIQKLREMGITQGCSATNFCPYDPVPRYSIAPLLFRALLN